MSITDTDREPLVRLLHDRIADDSATWELHADEAWFQVKPRGFEPRTQGWKLHVSATVDSAPDVLARCLDVLLPARAAFKFAASRRRVAELNGGRYTRGGAGKFLTVYPVDDDQFRRVAAALDQATGGLAGPVILSDRPVRAGSLVHYRYGAFIGRRVLTNDGEYQLVVARPDGSLIEDSREAWYTAPDWEADPLADPPEKDDADGVLLNDRFVVRRAIRHANKGGVFEATDGRTGATVVVKQARAHVGAGPAGWDTHSALRNEARVLDLLAPTGIAPRCLDVFEQGGDLFLAQERIEGRTLAAWLGVTGRPGLTWPQVAGIGRRLVDLVGVVHAHDLVIRDLSPTNLMVGDDGALHLIDVEYTVAAGSVLPPMGTAGYAAPEQLRTGPAEQTADRYALGALLWFLVTGADPLLPSARYADWWAEFAADVNCGPLLLGLLAEHPADRWDLNRVRNFLDTPPSAPKPQRPAFDLDRMLADGTDYLLATMTPQGERLWPVSAYGESSDVCNVQNGAAGVLAVLTWLRQHDAVRTAAHWIELMSGREPGRSPGLYFGRSGMLWALYDAAVLLGDDALAARSIAAAEDLPEHWPNPDVTHGMAGAGLACLHLWQQTGNPRIRDKAVGYAEALAESVQRPDGVPLWPIPEDFESRLAGTADYGFAHGTAGVATFLLTAGRLLDRPEWVDLAVEAGTALARVARQENDGGGARWTSGPRDATNPLVYWCSGSSGIGTFLIRLWQHTGDPATLALAEQAAEAVWRYRWQASSAVCHGLAGNGEFLLDLADATGSPKHRERAADLAAALAVRATEHDGRLLAPDETMTGFGADYGVGVAGWVAFLHRLRHGGPRRWLP